MGGTGIHTHGTPIASITIYVNDLILGCVCKHLVIDNKFHGISPGLEK
jgi:purine-nucleoside phosphorylase